MCQAAPKGRCSNHAGKDVEDSKKDVEVNKQEISDYDQKYNAAAKKAKQEFGYTDEEIEYSHTDDYLSDVTKYRNLRDRKINDGKQLQKELDKNQVHFDATPKGLKELEDKTDSQSRSRLLAAQALIDWQSKLKEYKDENGVRVIDKEGNPIARKALYDRSAVEAVASGAQAERDLEHSKMQLEKIRAEIDRNQNLGIERAGKVILLRKQEDNYIRKVDVYSQRVALASAKSELIAKAVASDTKHYRKHTSVNQKSVREAAKNLSTDNGPFADKVSNILASQAEGLGKTYFKEVNHPSRPGSKGHLRSVALDAKAQISEESSKQFDELRATKSPDDALKTMRKIVKKKHSEQLLAIAAAKNTTETETARAKAISYQDIADVLAGKRKV